MIKWINMDGRENLQQKKKNKKKYQITFWLNNRKAVEKSRRKLYFFFLSKAAIDVDLARWFSATFNLTSIPSRTLYTAHTNPLVRNRCIYFCWHSKFNFIFYFISLKIEMKNKRMNFVSVPLHSGQIEPIKKHTGTHHSRTRFMFRFVSKTHYEILFFTRTRQNRCNSCLNLFEKKKKNKNL